MAAGSATDPTAVAGSSPAAEADAMTDVGADDATTGDVAMATADEEVAGEDAGTAAAVATRGLEVRDAMLGMDTSASRRQRTPANRAANTAISHFPRTTGWLSSGATPNPWSMRAPSVLPSAPGEGGNRLGTRRSGVGGWGEVLDNARSLTGRGGSGPQVGSGWLAAF